jgi:hypothetical protein
LVLGAAVQSVFHAFSAVLTVPLVAAVIVLRAPAEARRRALGHALGVLCPVGLIGLATVLYARGATEVPFTETWRWPSLTEAAGAIPAIVAPGGRARGALVLGGVALSLVLLARDLRSGGRSREERAVGAAGALCMAVGVLGPVDVPGWQYLSPRFLSLGVILSLVTLPSERWRATGGGAGRALGALLGLASIVASCLLARRLHTACAPMLAGLDAPVHIQTLELPVVLDPYCSLPADPASSPVPYASPARHLGALYATALGGSVPGLFVGLPALHAFRPRPAREAPQIPTIPLEELWPDVDPRFDHEPGVRDAALNRLSVYGAGFEALVLLGATTDDVATFRRRGFAVAWAGAATTIFSFQGCQGSLAFAGERPHGTRRVAFGVEPLPTPIWQGNLEMDRLPPGPIRLPVRLCGRWWAQVGEARQGLCANADERGVVHGEVTPEQPSLVCAHPDGSPTH